MLTDTDKILLVDQLADWIQDKGLSLSLQAFGVITLDKSTLQDLCTRFYELGKNAK